MHKIKFDQIKAFLPLFSEEICNYYIKHADSSGTVFEDSEIQKKIFSELFPYPLRILVSLESFTKLLDDFKIELEPHEKSLSFVLDTENQLGLLIFKTDFNSDYSLDLSDNKIELKESHNSFELLWISGCLSFFENLAVDTRNLKNIDDNFESLPYSLRRFLIENILLGKKPSRAFFFLDEIGYLSKVLPEITAGKNLSQNKYHKYDIFEHLVNSCDSMEVPDLILRFSSLLHDIGKVPTRKLKENGEATFYNHEIISAHMLVPIMKRFGIPKSIGLKVKYYVRNHMFHYTDEWTDKAVRRFLRKVTREDLENLIHLRKSDRLGSGKKDPYPKKLQKLIDHIDEVIMRDMELKVTDLEVNGHDLMNMGLRQGPVMGKILNELLSMVKNEEIPNNRDIMLEKARELIHHYSPGLTI